MDQVFGRLPPGKILCLTDILHINTQHYNLDLTLSKAAYQTPGYESSVSCEQGANTPYILSQVCAEKNYE